MSTADPPDLPPSPMENGSSQRGGNGSDQVTAKDLENLVNQKVSGEDGSTDQSSKDLGLGKTIAAPTTQEVKGSWVGVVQGQKVLKKYEVEIEMKDGVGSVRVPEEITKDVAPLWDDFLIGKFLDNAPHIAKVHSIVNKIWTLNDKTQKIEVFEVNPTSMKLRVLNQADKNRILRRGMWNIAGVPVVMTKWSPIVEKEKPPTQSIPMWVHVKHFPLKMFSWQGLSFVTSPLGVPGRLHPETAQCLNLEVAKIFVNVDLTKDLSKQLNFNIQGEEVMVEYSYPWLPKKCLKCNKWGHSEKTCYVGKEREQKDLEEGEIRKEVQENVKETVEELKDQEVSIQSDNIEGEIDKNHREEVQQEEGRKEVSVEKAQTVNAMEEKLEWAAVSPGKASRTPSPRKDLEFGQIEEESSSEEKEDDVIVSRQCLPRESKINHRASKHLVVKEWIRKSGFQFGCLIETRVKESKVKGILEKVVPGWSYMANYEYNRLGRIWVLWSPGVRMTPCFQSDQIITVSMLLEGMDEEVFCSFIYGKNLVEERRELWRDLKSHQDSSIIRKAPWIILGDFNEILHGFEHSVVGASEDTMGKNEAEKPFKFINALVDTSEFFKLVEEFWSETEPLFNSTSALFRLSKKLKALKSHLRKLSKEKFGGIFKKTSEAYKNLCEAQTKTLENPDQINMEAESAAYGRWLILSIEEKVISQRAKIFWLEVGDGNNKSFHRAAKVREIRNAIREIKRSDGSVADNQEDIKKEAVDHFHKFLTHNPEDYEGARLEDLKTLLNYDCSESDRSMLIGDVSTEEVRKVLFSMAADKSPGPDGYTMEFFKASWAITGTDFVVAIKSFFDKGFLPKGINSTILALIPKNNAATYYRPISCCNVIYKVISKILANRMKRLLPLFVSLNQSAFVKDRLLMENVLLASELVKSYHKETVSERCAVKIDISKAFDSVQWSFLLRVLEALNFPAKFILWIQKCIELASFSVQINGELAGYFNSKRGLRQGCSLSPYLFVICMQVLSKLLDRAAYEKRIGYHPYCEELRLTHICFADDILVFSDGRKESVDGILAVFKQFARMSGLNISLEKSTLYLAGVKAEGSVAIMEQFPFEAGSLPVRYLGLPLLTKRMNAQDYSLLISRIKARISSWTARHLTFAGRLQLVGSVIYSITNFWMSAYRLPNGCIQEINSICAAFLWSGPVLSTHKAKIAWSEVCKPKDEGGLGLRNLTEANRVSCLKLIWRLLSARASLWVKWIWKYLIRKGSFCSVKESSVLGSWMWKKLIKLRPLAQQLTRMEINSGSNTSFWLEKWSPLGVLIELTGDGGCMALGIPLNTTVERAIQIYRTRRHRTPEYIMIEQEIMKLKARGLNDLEDDCLWKRENGDFRLGFVTSHTWNLTRVHSAKVFWSKGIWIPEATPKFAFIAWVAMHNRLATGDRVIKWNPQANSTCWLCQNDFETRDHLFFMCSYSQEVWRKTIGDLTGSSSIYQWSLVVRTVVNGLQERNAKFLLRYCFQAVVYALWLERNARRVGGYSQPVSCLSTRLEKLVRNRITSLRRKNWKKYEKAMEVWMGRSFI
ncbi:uncharacterized protein LOC130511120 [Raphanus sativus]|uniref:Uncharacterized protein LOC130511120 n=1 Tax=Raphanus sativus TaxID=3726 RepID=A0A9W3DJZ9_RAPSA|nr:uncharacterized protein LOC130511120 [Raphanus sativus]